MVWAGKPGPLSAMTIVLSFTAIEITGATSASSQASSALSTNSLSTTSDHCQTSCPVWFTNSRRVQNSISRETVNGTRVSFLFADGSEVSRGSALPQFVKSASSDAADLACSIDVLAAD